MKASLPVPVIIILLFFSMLLSQPVPTHSCSLAPPTFGREYHFGVTATAYQRDGTQVGQADYSGGLGADCQVRVSHKIVDPEANKVVIGGQFLTINTSGMNTYRTVGDNFYYDSTGESTWHLEGLNSTTLFYRQSSSTLKLEDIDTGHYEELIINFTSITASLPGDTSYENEHQSFSVAPYQHLAYAIVNNISDYYLVTFDIDDRSYNSVYLGNATLLEDSRTKLSDDGSSLLLHTLTESSIEFYQVDFTEGIISSYSYPDITSLGYYTAHENIALYDSTLYLLHASNITTHSLSTGETIVLPFTGDSLVILSDYILVFDGEISQTGVGVPISIWTLFPSFILLYSLRRRQQ